MYDCVGNIHIHTRYSDGSGSIPEIAHSAEKAGLDFIIITDHHHLRGKAEEGYYGRVLVMVGSEFNTDRNHYLGIDIDQEVPGSDENPQQVIDGVHHQGGIGFLAHPFEIGSPVYENGKTYPWTDWSVTGFTGIDIWSYLSQWRDGIPGVPKGIYLYFNPHQAFKRGPHQASLEKWDELLQERMVVGIGCSDAHAIKIKLGPWKPIISDYYTCFRCINTHLILKEPLSGNFKTDKEAIVETLRAGRCFVGYDFFKNSRGFCFVADTGGRIKHMGERAPARGTVLKVDTPAKAKVVLIKNGKPYLRSEGKRHRFFQLRPGVYRIEAQHRHGLGYRAWIYSNPIYLD
ncbi:MAG: CehA/McbA family metallohydrolase [Bacillota bacterium]